LPYENIMRRLIPPILFAITLFAPALKSYAQSVPKSLESADSLFKQYKLGDSRAAYRLIATDSTIEKGARAKAYLKLAEQDWKFYNDFAAAIRSLRSARVLNDDLQAVNLLEASINLENKKYDEALRNSRESFLSANNAQTHIESGILFSEILLNENLYGITDNQKLNKDNLKEFRKFLNRVLKQQPGNPEASDLLIGFGLLLKDGPTILKGWKSYYLVNDEKDINEVLLPAFRELKSVLQRWKGGTLNAQQMKTLATGFADSKFFNYANYQTAAIKKSYPGVFYHSKQLQDIVAYQAYITEVKSVNDKIYPEVARGKTNYEDQYDALMNIAGRHLWDKLSYINKARKFDPDTLYNILIRKYGLEGYTGNTVNYYGMLMGHIIHRELKQISQYGYSTKFTYISVDRLISRDFTSWYGTTNVGGWGDSTTIIQVRKAYMTEPFQELNWMTDTAEHKKILDLIAKKKHDDFEVCRKDRFAEPKFLAIYLKFHEASKIYKRLSASGLQGMELNIGFIDEILKLTVASTVFAHEGRHAIDQLYFPTEFKAMTDDERELRAKFSEVVYSLNPKMAFTGSILGSDLDEHTNHGKANMRFRKIIVDWMTAHEAEISGLDKNVPLLMQFDLLTDAQLIAICKNADPIAKNHAN